MDRGILHALRYAGSVIHLGTGSFTRQECNFLETAKHPDKDIHAAALDDIRCRYATALMEATCDPDHAEVFLEKCKAAFRDTKGHWQKVAGGMQQERER